jgi:hypothetical protein
MLQTILYILGTLLILLGAFGARLPHVSIEWLGVAILAFAALLLPKIGG